MNINDSIEISKYSILTVEYNHDEKRLLFLSLCILNGYAWFTLSLTRVKKKKNKLY